MLVGTYCWNRSDSVGGEDVIHEKYGAAWGAIRYLTLEGFLYVDT
jgi:hypothetical protein